jgi:hypothetical protein
MLGASQIPGTVLVDYLLASVVLVEIKKLKIYEAI